MTGSISDPQESTVALREARRHLLRTGGTDADLRTLLGLGVTPEFYEQLAGTVSRSGQTGAQLARLAEVLLLDAGLPVKEVRSWLEIGLGASDAFWMTQLYALAWDDAERPGQAARDPKTDSGLAAWRRALPGDLVPIAWAAGLTRQEARDQLQRSGFAPHQWRQAAAGRGYAMPAMAGLPRLA